MSRVTPMEQLSVSDVVANPVLAEVIRSGFVESRHRGSIVAIGADGMYAFTAGSANTPIFPRSSNKPLQAAAMLRAGLPIEGELLALAAASHSGEDFHVQGVRDILDYGGLTESYLSPEHPLQVHIRRTIEELAREPVAAVGVDGCGAPLFALTLGGVARAFRALVLAEPGSPERKVADAMRKFPSWTSGTTRDEHRLMTEIPGLLLKAGAEGVDAFALPDGTAAAVKIEDGNARARTPVTVALLAVLGAQPPVELATTDVLGGGRAVGVIRATRLA